MTRAGLKMLAIAAPLSAESVGGLLLGLTVLLGAAYALGLIARLLGMPAIVGELAAGVLLGPSLLGKLFPAAQAWLLPTSEESLHLVDAVGLIGLLCLVGITGAHLDIPLLRRQGKTAITISVCGLLVPLGFGIAFGLASPGLLSGHNSNAPTLYPLFLGVAMSVTAIPVIAKTLIDMNLMHRTIGQLTLAAGMVDDAVGWLLLSILSTAALAQVTPLIVLTSVMAMIGFLGVAMLSSILLRKYLQTTARADSPERIVGIVGIVILGFATITQLLHMEPILGAFVAGLIVSSSGPAVQRLLAPLRTVTIAILAPIFLATAGLRMDLTALTDLKIVALACGVLAIAIAGKLLGAYGGARFSGLSHWEGIALGAGMNARGVVEVIVAMTGLRLGILNTAGYTVIVLVAVVTSLVAPLLLRLAFSRLKVTRDEELRVENGAIVDIRDCSTANAST